MNSKSPTRQLRGIENFEVFEDNLERRHFNSRFIERKFENKKTQTLQVSQNSVSIQAELRWGTCAVETQTDSNSMVKPVARVAPLNQEWFIYNDEAFPLEL